MGKLRRELRHMGSLVTFEAAARAENFSRAAEALGVTRVSVSRQIGQLEASLGVTLFRREHRKTALTHAGARLQTTVGPALNAIADALDDIRLDAGDQRLRVTTTPAFATYWLMPRLAEFAVARPDVAFDLVVSDRRLDLDAEGVDVAIRYTDTPPAGDAEPLFRERVFPVHSAKYRPNTALARPADLLKERLLHLVGAYRPGTRWSHWFSHQDVRAPTTRSGVRVNTYAMLVQAALEGQGVALLGSPLVDDLLQSGALIAPGAMPSVVRHRYYLIAASARSPLAAEFRQWLRARIS